MAEGIENKWKPQRIISVDFSKKKRQKPPPWLDARGLPLPENKLKRRSKRWSPEIWEAYLESLETGLRENLGWSKDRSVLLTEFANTEDGLEASTHQLLEFEPERHERRDRAWSVTAFFQETENRKESDPIEEVTPKEEEAGVQIALSASDQAVQFDLHTEVEAAMASLNENEALVIWRTFWEGRSEREIALVMRRSRRSVRTWKDRAFSKLKPILSPTFLMYEGESVSSLRSTSKPIGIISSKRS